MAAKCRPAADFIAGVTAISTFCLATYKCLLDRVLYKKLAKRGAFLVDPFEPT
jgi:hypothetical protein